MGKRLNKEEFIKRAKLIHGDRYDYSKVNYINNSTKIILFDNVLKEYFTITPASILNGCGNKNNVKNILSQKFSMGKNTFIEKAMKKHGDRYDYSKVNYINNRTKVCIICPEHGEFQQTPDKHLRGQGCPKCCRKNKKYTTDEFIERAIKIHGNLYDYSETIYGKNKKEKVKITCPKHGPFLITPESHLQGGGCKYCTVGEVFNTEDFINKAKNIHKNKYIYDKTIFTGAFNKVIITCPQHGDFLQTPHKHIQGHGCPECAKLFRKKETELYNILKSVFKENNIIHSYYNPKILGKQEIDIYFPNEKIGIEFQGEQHFTPIDFSGRGVEWATKLFEDNQQRDIKKKEVCNNNNITLLYFSNVLEDEFLGEKVYHKYSDLIEKINQVIKKEEEK